MRSRFLEVVRGLLKDSSVGGECRYLINLVAWYMGETQEQMCI